jgi:hypothetical protein
MSGEAHALLLVPVTHWLVAMAQQPPLQVKENWQLVPHCWFGPQLSNAGQSVACWQPH